MKNKKLAKDTLWNAIDYISTLGIFVITTKLIITQFGTDGYGFYVFFTSLVGLFAMVDLGMGMAVSKYLSESALQKDYVKSSEIINVALIFYATFSFLIVSIVYIFSEEIIGFLRFGSMYYETGVVVIKLVALIFVLNLISSVPNNILVALEQWVTISGINITFKVLNAAVLIYVVAFHDSDNQEKFIFIFSMLFVLSVIKFISLIVNIYCRSFEYYLVLPSHDIRTRILSFLKYSSLQYLLSLLMGHMDKFIIGRFFGLEVLGVYSFCVNAFVYIYGFVSNSFKVFYPKLSRLHAQLNVLSLKSWFFKLLMWIAVVSLIAGVGLLLLWQPVISIYIDPEFARASYYFIPFFAMFLCVRSPEIVMYYFFNATANPKVLVKNLMISAPISCMFYFILVPWLGALGFILSQMIGVFVLYLWHAKVIMMNGFEEYAFGRKVA